MWLRSFRNFAEYAFFLPVNWLARILPFRTAGAFGSLLGGLSYHILGFRKKVCMDNLVHAFPGHPIEELRGVAERTYRGYGRSIVEMLWAGGASEQQLRSTTRLLNPEIPRTALARGRGMILLSGHFGSWEFALTSLPLTLGVMSWESRSPRGTTILMPCLLLTGADLAARPSRCANPYGKL